MVALTTDGTGEACDSSPDFDYAVSLLAALEDATEQCGHAMVLPFLGMARAELTDFGQRRPARYTPVQIGDLQSGLADLERCLIALLAGSIELQHSLRINAALLTLRRGVIDAHPSSVGPQDGGRRVQVLRR